VAKRKKKPAAAKKPVKKKAPAKKKAKARPKKGAAAKKPSNKRKKGEKRRGTKVPDRAAGRAGSATLLPPKRPRTAIQSQGAEGTPSGSATSSDRDIAAIDDMCIVNHADRMVGQSCPLQTGEDAPPTHAAQIADGVADEEDRLEETAPHLVNADKDDLLRAALWWAGRARKPRAAIVGLALHELKSFTEELASKRGTADQICRRIRKSNRQHLRDEIHDKLDSEKAQEDIDSALVGLLNPAWAVLEKLQLLQAAPRAGVYLVGRGPKVFDGFPNWTDVDEPWPEKPTRPPRRPRS
jgi:hypothetical protein